MDQPHHFKQFLYLPTKSSESISWLDLQRKILGERDQMERLLRVGTKDLKGEIKTLMFSAPYSKKVPPFVRVRAGTYALDDE